MNEHLFNWVLMLEILFPLLVLAVVLLVVLVRNKSRLSASLRELIINVKDNEPEQAKAIKEFLQNKLAQPANSAEKTSAEIIKERKFFIRNLVSALLNKDLENLATLDDELSRVFEKYHSLNAVSVAPAPPANDSDDSGLQSELESRLATIESLKQENRLLKQEVHITLTTLNNIFAEYSSMFGEDVARKDMSVEQILTAMESFAGAGAAASAADVVEPVTASAQVETETAESLEFGSEAEDESVDASILDEMQLEQVNSDDSDSPDDNEDDEEPSWEDAFAESGEEMGKES